jgi:phage terminase small subunit
LSNLTDKQKLFVAEYLVDLNATQAAIRAGYSEKTAYSIGQENLNKPEITDAISRAFKKRAERTRVDADRVIKELARIAFATIGTMATWTGDAIVLKDSESLSDDDRAAIQEITRTETPNGANIRVKLSDKLTALEKLGRHLGMFQGKNLSVTPEEKAILQEFLDGEIDAVHAGVEFAKLGKPLPEVIRLQLSKMPAPEPEEDDAGAFSEEELDAKYQAQLQKIEEQKEKWKPERQQEIRKIKDELADKSQWEKTD